jgi:PAS domain S-box-containing protein
MAIVIPQESPITTQMGNSNLRFFEAMDQVNRAIQSTSHLEKMMSNVLTAVLEIFQCERTFLIFPCNPTAKKCRIPMAYNRAGKLEFPDEYPIHDKLAEMMKRLCDSELPVIFDNHQESALKDIFPAETHACLAMAIHPNVGEPWLFGIHSCSADRSWTDPESRLFQAIGRHLADGLSLRLTLHELKNRELSYSRIVNLSSEGIWSLDAQGKTSYVNSRMCEIIGYAADEIMGRPVTDFMFEEDIPDYLEKIKSGFRKVSPYERRYRRKNGEAVWVSVSATGIYDDAGEFIGGFGMMTDITEKRRAEEALRHLNEKLESKVEARSQELQAAHARILQQEKMVSVGQLASGLAHEINTPIQYLNNNIHFIIDSITEIFQGLDSSLQSLAQSPVHREALQTLQARLQDMDFDYLKQEIPRALEDSVEGINQIARIIHVMRDFAQPSRTQAEPVDLNVVIGNTLEVTRNSWKHHTEIQLALTDEPLLVMGHRDELGQMFLNLIINAADAIEASNRPGQIRIEAHRRDDGVEILVSDNGCGIPPEIQEKIFDPFFTTKEIGRGSGQGLAIAYHIVTDKHDGELRVDSTSGQGSTFSIRFPHLPSPDS